LNPGVGHISQEVIDQVRLAADIAEVVGRRIRLVQKGKDFWGLCPFHGDSAPSLKVDRARGTWHCFGCGEGGSVFNFVMRDQNMSFPEAVRELAAQCGVPLPAPRQTPEEQRAQEEKERLLQVLDLAGKFFRKQLDATPATEAREYLLTKRGLDQATVEAFGLGYAPGQWDGLRRYLTAQGVSEELGVAAGLLVRRDSGQGVYDRFRGRVIFPIRDLKGRAISFGGRVMGPDEPKYLNGPESPLFNKSRTLYNLDKARPAMRRKDRALVVEGYFDVITLAALGFEETVAPLGTALTPQHVRLLKGQARDLVLVFDGDQAGLRAATRALPLFLAEGLSPRVLLLPTGEDPDSFARAQGAPGMETALKQARPLTEMVLARLVSQGDTGTPEGKSAIVQEAGEVLKAIADPVTRTGYLERLAAQLALPPAVVAARLGLPLTGLKAQPPAARPGQGQGRACLVHDGEQALLELALAAPEAARVLAQGGALDDLAEPRFMALAQAILAVLGRGASPTPDAVSQTLDDQDLASLVSKLSLRCPQLNDPAAAAQSHLDLLARRRQRRQRAAITPAIVAAQAQGQADMVSQLQSQRGQLCTAHPLEPKTGKD
jgi:DNA primase